MEYNIYGDYSPGNEMYKDENGIPVKRTPITHPYSYDAYVIDGKFNKEFEKGYVNGCEYDDRLLQSDYKKYEALKVKYLSKGTNVATAQKLLREWFNNDSIIVVNVMKGCNVSNGYPYYVFQFHVDI